MPQPRLTALVAASLIALPLLNCTTEPTATHSLSSATSFALGGNGALVASTDSVRKLAAARGIVPLVRPPAVRPTLVRLGQALFFDKILSGNRDISCSTCHLPAFATSDGKSLSVGQGGTDLGPAREHPNGVFIPRNAPSVFNLGALRNLFWDGRVNVDAQGRVHTPAGTQLTPAMEHVFEFGAASALGLFPVTSRAEMRADTGNELAAIPDSDLQGIWSALMYRLGNIPEYRQMFEAAYPGTAFDNMTFAHASNAIGGFLVDQLSFNNTPWDRFMAGADGALSPSQREGAATFLTLKCSICHNGPTFSDEKFHNVAVAQIGPGEGNGASQRDDFGRFNVTGLSRDRYLFRTTPLRNVEITQPYGHDGAITSLRAFVEHYSESDKKLFGYDPLQLEPALRPTLLNTQIDILAQRDTLLQGVVLTSEIVDKLMNFMQALTDDNARSLIRIIPARVPSGLPVDRTQP